MGDPAARACVKFAHEMGILKRHARQGWWIVGVRDPETVAEHSFRTAVIAYVVACVEGANPDRAASLALFHDSQESRTGDVPSIGKRYLSAAGHEQITAEQIADLPDPAGAGILALVGEYERRETLEARVAKDADALECLLQALEYRDEGYRNVGLWVDSMAAAVRTGTGRRLADAALESAPADWWQAMVGEYGRAKAEGG